MKTRQSLLIGLAAMAALTASDGVTTRAPGISASVNIANQAARGQGNANFGGSALARILGSGGSYSSRSHVNSANGRGRSGVASAKRYARKVASVRARSPKRGRLKNRVRAA